MRRRALVGPEERTHQASEPFQVVHGGGVRRNVTAASKLLQRDDTREIAKLRSRRHERRGIFTAVQVE